MKTYKEFQEQLERGKVVPAQIPSSEQNRERVSDAGKSRRSLVKKLMYRTSLPVKKRHEKRMSDLLTSPHHSGMHGEDFHYQEDIQQTRRDLETIAKQDAASDKLSARKRAAQQNPIERTKDLESREQKRTGAQKERIAQHVERQKSQPKKKEFRPLLNFRSDTSDFKF